MISINIKDKIATVEGSPVIVCGNSDYMIRFAFDDEWADKTTKTARFVYLVLGQKQYQDVVFTGDTVSVPVLANTDEVAVGVFAGELSTTTPALIPCKRSIRCGTGAPADPMPDQYDQIMATMAGLAPREEWITIDDTTTEKELAEIVISKDLEGKEFSCRTIKFNITLPSTIETALSFMAFYVSKGVWGKEFHFEIPTGCKLISGEIEVIDGKYCDISYIALRNPSWVNAWNTIYNSRIIKGDLDKTKYIPVSEIVLQGVDSVMPVGTRIQVWGLKA